MKQIIIEENGLYVRFDIRDNGVTELQKFTPVHLKDGGVDGIVSEGIYHPLLQVQMTGRNSMRMHGFKHNACGGSEDFRYAEHTFQPTSDGKELIIHLVTDYEVHAYYHMRFYQDIPVVKVWSQLVNCGSKEIGLEYVSSFIYQDMCGDGELPYFCKTDIYTPYNSWSCEARWKIDDCEDLNLSRMPAYGFNSPGFGNNRYCYTGISSWSSDEFLPMGYAHDRETDETYVFQVESSGQWHIEYGSDQNSVHIERSLSREYIEENSRKHPHYRLSLGLSGPTEQEHGWWFDLGPQKQMTTVPAVFGVVHGGIDEATSAITRYRRQLRMPHTDNRKPFVIFNDFMNCLMGDPTEDKEKRVIDIAAEIGCEYYCLDCGWYTAGNWIEGVGEWTEASSRFPNGLKSLCDYVRSKGMVMGLWVEIEVMGCQSELANSLPDDWFICRHGRRFVDNSRYMLDFRNPAVRRHCMNIVDRLINDYGVGYFKFDYNVHMGRGTDINGVNSAQAMLEHYEGLYQWYCELYKKYPDLIIENCGSGGQRMDYGIMQYLNLQSTSDLTDPYYNSCITANVASAVLPEQAGTWVYPYLDEKEHIIYNLLNGILLRPYMSGMVWGLNAENRGLLKKGVSLYKEIREEMLTMVPFFPFGFNRPTDTVLAYGVQNEKRMYLEVFTTATDAARIPLSTDKKIVDVTVIFPDEDSCEYHMEENVLYIKMPQDHCARLFRIETKLF